MEYYFCEEQTLYLADSDSWKIIASSRLTPFRKDVLIKSGKLVGGGDFGRKRKLLDKQKEGKKKMKMIGKVEIPKEAFMKLFKRV